MLRINDEINHLIGSIQVTLRIRSGFHISKIDVVRRALNDLASKT